MNHKNAIVGHIEQLTEVPCMVEQGTIQNNDLLDSLIRKLNQINDTAKSEKAFKTSHEIDSLIALHKSGD